MPFIPYELHTEDVIKSENRGRKLDSNFRAYRKKVMILTEAVAHLVPGIEKRGFRKYHIDHKFSIWQGYLQDKTPQEIADISNLRMLHWRDNMAKGIKCVN